jgi:hypothetical protein
MSQTKHYNAVNPSKASDITLAWISRWLVKRISREETLNKLNDLGPDSVHKQLYFKVEDKSPNLFNLKRKSSA